MPSLMGFCSLLKNQKKILRCDRIVPVAAVLSNYVVPKSPRFHPSSPAKTETVSVTPRWVWLLMRAPELEETAHSFPLCQGQSISRLPLGAACRFIAALD